MEELFSSADFFIFVALLQAADLTKPLDKRLYKGTIPTCHDFNLLTRSAESLELLIGFSAGQVQLLDPVKHEVNKLFNEEVLFDFYYTIQKRNFPFQEWTCLMDSQT